MRDPRYRHAALVAYAHPAQWPPLFPTHRAAKCAHVVREQCSCHTHSRVNLERTSIDDDLHDTTASRIGEYGVASIGGVRPAMRSARRRAVPIELVMPSPSCPAAIHSPAVDAHGPMSGNLS